MRVDRELTIQKVELTPTQLLVNFFAAVDQPFMREELVLSLYRTVRRLSKEGVTALVDFRGGLFSDEGSLKDEIDSSDLGREFWFWSSNRLLTYDEMEKDWRVSPDQRKLFQRAVESVNKGLDPVIVESLKKTLQEVGVVKEDL